MTEPGAGAAPESAATCPWCAAPADSDATRCSACGAALAQRESIGDLKIPGLTSVDPALEDFDKRPLHLRGPSPSQGAAPMLIVGVAAGGPIGMIAIGGLAAVAGAEFLATRAGRPDGPDLEDVGKPSEVVLQALEHVDDARAGGPSAALANGPASEPDAADADGGLSIWRDLPPVDEQGG